MWIVYCSESVGYLDWLHRLSVLSSPFSDNRGEIRSLELLVSVIILKEAGSTGIACDEPKDDSFPEVKNEYAGVLRLEHHGRPNQEDDADHDILDVVTGLLE